MSSNINIVLVDTSHPGNIGSTARAMKTMGLNKLTLVTPKDFPSDIANAQAVGCIDILDNATIVGSLEQSVCDSVIVIGLSARPRKSSIPTLSMDQCIDLLNKFPNDEISIVFGNEQSGLSNEELQTCDYLVSIPTDEAYTSLNLAAAVQVFAYEYHKNRSKHQISDNKSDIAKHSTKNTLIQTFISIMLILDIITEKNKKSLIQNVHVIFNKSNLTDNEANLLLGVLSSIKKALQK